MIKITRKVPKLKSAKDLLDFIMTELDVLGEITVKETGQKISVSKRNIKRALKTKRNNKGNQVYSEFKELFESAKYLGFEKADKRHPNVKGQDVFLAKMELDGQVYDVLFRADVPLDKREEGNFYCAGHKIRIPTSDTEITRLVHSGDDGDIQTKKTQVNQKAIDDFIEKQACLAAWTLARANCYLFVLAPLLEASMNYLLRNTDDDDDESALAG